MEAVPEPSSLPNTLDVTVNNVVTWIMRHWLLLLLAYLSLWNLLPWLAPVFMKLGWETPARGIYFLYSFFCHQLPQRSWFLFGESFTYPKDEILLALNGNTDPVVPSTMRVFIGTPEMGWKVAWSDRMVSFYSGWVVVGLVYALVRRRWKGLSWKWALLLLLPLALDGGTHLLSDLGNIREGFRESNAWLAMLTNNYFPPEFYAGDQWGSFNSMARLITGALGAVGLMGIVLPFLDRTISGAIDDIPK